MISRIVRTTIFALVAVMATGAGFAESSGSGGSHGGGGHGGGGSHGGGSHGGGSHGGGSHGGSGGHGGGGHDGHGGDHGGHGHGGGYYGGYWGPGWWGPGGWWGWDWGYPYGYGYGYGYPYHYGYTADAVASDWTQVKTDVDPEEAALYLDGRLIGTADDFDGYPDVLYLRRGQYRLEFRLDGFENLDVDVDASPGAFVRIDQKMKKIPGAKHYGTYSPSRPEGGVIRYFGKKNGSDVAESEGAEGGEGYGPEARPPRQHEPPIAPGPSYSASASMDAESEARLVFNVTPTDAAVYLDDRFAGSARDLNRMSHGIAVPPGSHRITVTRPGFIDQTITVEVSEGKRTPVAVTLAATPGAP